MFIKQFYYYRNKNGKNNSHYKQESVYRVIIKVNQQSRFITGDNSTLSGNTNYGYSDYIKIDSDTNYIVFHPWSCNETVLAYDNNKNLIKRYYYNTITSLEETTAVGAHSGSSKGSGSNNISIGYFAKPNADLNNTIIIGNEISANADGEMVLGDIHTSTIIMVHNGIKKVLVFNNDGTVSWENYNQ